MNTKQLRQKILDLAIRGKLVPQDLNDEPASVLLEKIRAEKEKLIREKKIKRDKNDFSNSGSGMSHYQNVPFLVPDSWGWVRVKDIAKIGTGSTPLTSNSSYYVGGKIPWINSSATNNTYINSASTHITEKALIETNCSVYPIGTLIVAMYGEGKTRGQLSELKIEAATNQACAAIQLYLNERVLIDFIKYCFQNNYEVLRSESKGGNQPNLNLTIISNFLFPLPPLSEQRRIVSTIKTAFTLIDEIDSNKLSLEQFIKQTKSKVLDLAIRGKLVPQVPDDEPASALLERIRNEQKTKKTTADIFPYPFEIPENWVWCRLGEVGNWQSGATPSRANKDYYNGDILWLKTGDLTDDYIYDISETITQKALRETSVKLNPGGSILMAMYGATIGKVGILTIPATTNQACCACSNFKDIYNLYLFHVLIAYRKYFIQKGEGGAQPNISKEKIISTFIPLPPLPEQYRIVTQIEKIFAHLNEIEKIIVTM